MWEEIPDRATEERPVVRRHDDAEGLKKREHDRHIPRVLRDLLLPHLAFLLQGFEAGDDDRQQLHDDRGRDVRHDAQREHRHLCQRFAAEQVDQRVDAAARRRLPFERAQLRDVDARQRDVRTQPVDGDDEQCEQDLVPEIRDLEGVPERAEHEPS